jgi:DoxX-like family
MNIIIWILQGVAAFTFMFSGINKSIYSEKTLVLKGQTGVEGLPLMLIRFIGAGEILGVIGLILPMLLNIYPNLTSVSAICLGLIMIPAGIIHYKRKEFKNVIVNFVILSVCFAIAYFRR